MAKKICIVIGTRPEAIKMAPVYRAFTSSKTCTPILLSSGQHREMLHDALSTFDLKADVDFAVMTNSQDLASTFARIVTSCSKYFKSSRPSAVLVQGDTSTVLAASLAAFYSGIPVGHVEAGLRTHNFLEPWPEEMNRRLTTPLAKWLFAPTPLSRDNLLAENIPPANCFVTGNTVIDALMWTRDRVDMTAEGIATKLSIPRHFSESFLHLNQTFILVTAHRRESLETGISNICLALQRLAHAYPSVGILFPVHLNPRVRQTVHSRLGGTHNIALIDPVPYSEFVWLMDRCHFLISDSGGIQEEAPSLGKPVLVTRETTERPEGVLAGTCTLVGTNPERIFREAEQLINDSDIYRTRSSLKNPYGDGSASARIQEIVESTL